MSSQDMAQWVNLDILKNSQSKILDIYLYMPTINILATLHATFYIIIYDSKFYNFSQKKNENFVRKCLKNTKRKRIFFAKTRGQLKLSLFTNEPGQWEIPGAGEIL